MRQATISGTSGICSKSSVKAKIRPAVEKSSATMIFRLFTRSATTPPMGEHSTAGRNAAAPTAPNSPADPVCRSRYSGNAKRKMALPKREMICPMTTRVKSRRNRGV